jgi:predicted ATPase/DNA-binding XRE family transcriptional regulator
MKPIHRLLTVCDAAIVDKARDRLGQLLKQFRTAAGLTQEELAERAGISARTVSDVERGLRTAMYPDTARKLAAALGLDEDARDRFEAAARGHASAPPQPESNSLPIPPTPLVGRADELDAVIAALKNPAVRLLTLTGPGGIGKTRLALEVAARELTSFSDGVFFVSLGEVHDPELVAPAIAKAIGVVEVGERIPLLIERRLAGRRALILLDTFEHLLPAALLVSSLLVRAPESKFLVTSRRRLHLRGENELPIPPLDLNSAAALFSERAGAMVDDTELVLDICRQLDGLPLAIELAAARVKHLPLPALASQLNHRLRLLTDGPLDLPVRQRAIRETVAWSDDLLTAPERALFRRLAVFSGGWSLASAGPVCDVREPLSVISTLIDHSLVVLVGNHAEARYDMLDVIREYAAERLLEAGEQESTARRHALHHLELAQEGEANLVGSRQDDWSRRLDAERGNLRRAIAWAIEQRDNTLALQFTVALWRYWRHTGEFAEGRRWSEAALAMPGPSPDSLRAKALWATAFLCYPQGDYARMAELAAEDLEVARRGGDRMDLRNALTVAGQVAMCEGRYADALEPLRQSLDICRGLGLTWQLGTSHLNLGNALLHSGKPAEAQRLYAEGLKVYRELGDETFASRTKNTIAHAALAQDDLDQADRLAREALIGFAKQRDRMGVAEALDTLAAVGAASGDPARAARLDGAAAAIHARIASKPAPFEQAITRRFILASEALAGRDQWQAAWTAGHTLSLEAAIDYAVGRPDASKRT